jgi:hypothetical protein
LVELAEFSLTSWSEGEFAWPDVAFEGLGNSGALPRQALHDMRTTTSSQVVTGHESTLFCERSHLASRDEQLLSVPAMGHGKTLNDTEGGCCLSMMNVGYLDMLLGVNMALP